MDEIQLLLVSGADPDIELPEALSPLECAKKEERLDLVDLMLSLNKKATVGP
jgi:hypothetical protein